MPVKEKDEAQALIEAAISAAVEACMQGIDEKIQEAVNLGVTIGATAGAEVGASAAIKAVEREKKKLKKQQYDWKYHNTKLLLRNYRRLKAYNKNVVYYVKGAEETSLDFWKAMQSIGDRITDEDVFVESIKKNAITTKIIMTHVDKMLKCYEIMCTRSGRFEDSRHWRVLKGLYLADGYASADEIAYRENIDKRTVYRDINICISDLTCLFFGVSGIEEM